MIESTTAQIFSMIIKENGSCNNWINGYWGQKGFLFNLGIEIWPIIGSHDNDVFAFMIPVMLICDDDDS